MFGWFGSTVILQSIMASSSFLNQSKDLGHRCFDLFLWDGSSLSYVAVSWSSALQNHSSPMLTLHRAPASPSPSPSPPLAHKADTDDRSEQEDQWAARRKPSRLRG